MKCVIVYIMVSHKVKRVFDAELNWHLVTCPGGAFNFSIDHFFDDFVQWRADFVWKQIEIYQLGFFYQAQGNYTLFENLQHNGSSPGKKAIMGITKPGLYLKHGHVRSPECHLENIDENMKMITKHYSHLFLSGEKHIWDNMDMHVRISTATSLNVREELRLYIDLNDVQGYWAKFSFVRFNCSSVVAEPLGFPYLYLDLERERYCKAKKIEYSEWEKAIEHEGFTTYYPVKFSTCMCNTTATYFDNPPKASKVALVLNNVSAYYRNFAMPQTQIVLKNDESIYVTLRFTKLASNFPHSYTSMDTNVSVLLPSNQTEILIPITVLPFCKKETWFSQPCEFIINPRNPSSAKNLNISIQMLPAPHLNSTGHFFNLFPLCGDTQRLEHCLNEFVTWQQAFDMCTDMNMSLPAAYSQRDMKEMQKVIDIYQRNLSCGKLGNIDVLYNTIGIYIGINFNVSI